MRDFDDRIENSGTTAAGRLSAAEDNVRFKEMERMVSTFGITLDPQAGPDTDLYMMAQAAARAASMGIFGTCAGSANTYSVSAGASNRVPKALFDGMLVLTEPSATNTGASTANVFGLGSKKVRSFADADLIGGELDATKYSMWIYDSSADSATGAWLVLPWTAGNNLTSDGGPKLHYATFSLALVASLSHATDQALTPTLSASAGPVPTISTTDITPAAGDYLCFATVGIDTEVNAATNVAQIARLKKNGTQFALDFESIYLPGTGDVTTYPSAIGRVTMNGSDTLSVAAYTACTSAGHFTAANALASTLQLFRVA